jgi:hypothetical protein
MANARFFEGDCHPRLMNLYSKGGPKALLKRSSTSILSCDRLSIPDSGAESVEGAPTEKQGVPSSSELHPGARRYPRVGQPRERLAPSVHPVLMNELAAVCRKRSRRLFRSSKTRRSNRRRAGVAFERCWMIAEINSTTTVAARLQVRICPKVPTPRAGDIDGLQTTRTPARPAHLQWLLRCLMLGLSGQPTDSREAVRVDPAERAAAARAEVRRAWLR